MGRRLALAFSKLGAQTAGVMKTAPPWRGYVLRAAVLFCMAWAFQNLLGAASVPPPAAGKTRLVCWNLHWFPGHTPDASAAEAAAHMKGAQGALAELRPDVLLTQEVRTWQSMLDLTAPGGRLTPHVVSTFERMVPDARPQNQAVASRFVADSGWTERWKGGPGGPPRGYAFSALEVGGGRFLLCWSLHLKSNIGDLGEVIVSRSEAARQLLEHVRAMVALYSKRGPCAVVVAGDMNTSVDDPVYAKEPTLRALSASGLWWTHNGVPFNKRTTIPAENGFADNCFDHVFTAGLGRPVAFVAPFPGLSDHFPVVLDVDLAAADFKPVLDVEAGMKLLATAEGVRAALHVPTQTLKATDEAGIRAAIGQTVTVQGKISRVSNTADRSIHFVNFEGTKRGEFTVIVRRFSLSKVEAKSGPLKGLVGTTVSVTGMVTTYKDTPQIELHSGDGLRVEP